MENVSRPDLNPKHKTGPVMKADGGIGGKPPILTALAEMERDDWRPIDTVPKDGTYVYLKERNGKIGEYYWYRTRQFRKGVWQQIAWWRERFGPNFPRSFDPIGWRRSSEGLPKP